MARTACSNTALLLVIMIQVFIDNVVHHNRILSLLGVFVSIALVFDTIEFYKIYKEEKQNETK